MHRLGFKMRVFSGMEQEYKKRHDAIWPELVALLKQHGISHYSIFLDEETRTLFGVLHVNNPEILNKLPSEPVLRKWWDYMKDIMETNEDHSPVSIPLKEVFYLP